MNLLLYIISKFYDTLYFAETLHTYQLSMKEKYLSVETCNLKFVYNTR